MTESYKLIKNDGTELEFGFGDYDLKGLGALGNPPIKYDTQKAYYMDGQEITNFSIDVRQLNLPLITKNDNFNKRTDFWDLRREILSFLSPLSGAMTFEITTDDHITYELTNIYPTDGLSLDGNTYNDSRNDGRIDEVLRLTAFDPIWRIKQINSSGSLIPVIANELSFPMNFPLEFGSNGANFNQTISYSGTWRSYPRITINGPYSVATFNNTATGATFQLVRAISTGETRVIDLTDPIAGFTIVDGFGINKISEVNLGANFTQFYFNPDTTNGIDATLAGGNLSDTRITIEWYTKYLGI